MSWLTLWVETSRRGVRRPLYVLRNLNTLSSVSEETAGKWPALDAWRSGRAASFKWTPASMPHSGLQEDSQEPVGDKGVLRKLADQKKTGHPRGRPQSTGPVYKGCSRA